MHETLDGPVLGIARPAHATYIDDVTVHGAEWVAVFRDSLYAVARMAAKGLPLSAAKCHFVGEEQAILGVEILGPTREFRIGNKALKLLLGCTLPRSHRELQALLGKFNFCSQFLPDYRRRAKPLLALLSSRSDGKWTAEHTCIANDLAREVRKRIRLGIVDFAREGRLHVDCDYTDCSAILTQGAGD